MAKVRVGFSGREAAPFALLRMTDKRGKRGAGEAQVVSGVRLGRWVGGLAIQ